MPTALIKEACALKPAVSPNRDFGVKKIVNMNRLAKYHDVYLERNFNEETKT